MPAGVWENILAGRKCGTKTRVPLDGIQKHYLLMESLLIEPPLSILTLMMWIEFLSV
jgi:hypothetical protein